MKKALTAIDEAVRRFTSFKKYIISQVNFYYQVRAV